MSGNFGNVLINIEDSATPSAPASGTTVFSASGVLKGINSSKTVTYLADTSSSEGDILIGNGTTYVPLNIGYDNQIPTVASGTLQYQNPPMAMYSGLAHFPSETLLVTISDASITADTIVVGCSYDAANVGDMLTPVFVHSITDGSFVLALQQTLFDDSGDAFYMYQSPIGAQSDPVYSGVMTLTSFGGTSNGTVTHPAITTSSKVVVTALGTTSEYGMVVTNLTNGSFSVYTADLTVGAAFYMFQG